MRTADTVKRTLAATSLLALAGAAQAQLSLTGGTAVSFSGYSAEDILGTGAVSSALSNSTLFADFSGTLSVTFLGKETEQSNSVTFTLGNLATLTIDTTDPVPTTVSGLVDGGELNFSFRNATEGQVATNGVALQSGAASFAVFGTVLDGVFTPNTAGGAYTYVVGFNDGAGANADYDDLVVGLRLTPAVPEPATCGLMLAGLGVVGLVARRRRQRR